MQTDNRDITIAVAGAALIHLLVLSVVAILLVLGPHLAVAIPRPEPAEPEEITIQMPSILIPPAPFEEPVPELDEPDVPDNPDAEKASKTYVRTTQNDPEDDAPSDARFESDRNTTAAADQSATSNLDLPSQDGIDLPMIELETREYIDGELADDRTQGDDAPETLATNTPPTPPTPPAPVEPLQPILTPEDNQPSDTDGQLTDQPDDPSTGIAQVAKLSPPRAMEVLEDFPYDPDTPNTIPLPDLPQEPEPPEETIDLLEPGEISLEEPGDLVRKNQQQLAESQPPPRPPPDPKPKPGDPNANQKDVFQPHTRTTHFEGGINRTGKSAVDAASTPLGKYGKAVTGAIEKKWHLYRLQNAEFLTYATMKLQFQVDANGKVRNLQILDNDAPAIMTDFTLSAILEAPLPKIPQDVLELLDDGRFNITYNVVVY